MDESARMHMVQRPRERGPQFRSMRAKREQRLFAFEALPWLTSQWLLSRK